ncbi:extracellular matrix-binding protein EbhB-like [Littorina saxatilis]|uniref:Uncharacterized protein n=1 Tax=Littorina saxatilis TaxID=31220 RepID=A0AAN9B276_9CAEN
MWLETLSWLVALVAVTSGQAYYGAGREVGRISARLQNQNTNSGARDQATQRRDSNRFDGNADQRARWTGQNAVRENGLNQNEQALQERAQKANQNFGRFSNNFGNIAKQIRDEALRNQYVIRDDSQYKKNNLNSAQGANAANARKTAFDRGEQLDDNINYAFSKQFDKASSENGGYEEENGRNLRKLDLIDEREKDRKLLRGDSSVSRSNSDEQKAAKDTEWKSNAAQKQAQEGKYGFADRRVDQAGERSDDRAVDYDRKDSRYLEQETGRDEAVRLAKDLAEQAAGYNNEAQAAADSNRGVADKKYYGGKELGPNGIVGAHHDGYGPGDAVAAAAAVNGDKAKHEGSGGVIKTGFDENALQNEQGNELAAARALSSAEAVNDYQRNKDKLAYDQVRGLQDRTQGQFKQGLQDAASQGFSGNNAEAAKSAAEWDKAQAAKSSKSDLIAKEKNENEALRDRNYFRKIQNDDNETFTRRKQFYHNKKDAGNNDENLKYLRKKNARNFGAADEADLSKQNNFQNLHQNSKLASQNRNFDDLVDRRASVQHENEVRNADANGFDNRASNDRNQAQATGTGTNRALNRQNQDDSQSTYFNRRQSLDDQNDATKHVAQDQKQSGRATAADIEYVRPTNGNPLGDVSSRDFISGDLLRGEIADKSQKDYTLPDVIVDIKPIAPPPKIEQPRRQRPIPALPTVQQVKSYKAPKYNKQEVNYDTGRSTNLGNFNRPSFQRIPNLSLFRGPRQSTLNTKPASKPKSRFALNRLSSKQPATSNFGRNLLGGGNQFNRGYVRGSFAGRG